MTREKLPPRRRSATRKIRHLGRSYHITVGFAADGRPLEVFAHGARSGSDQDAIVDDSCILLSYAYQFGVRPVELEQRFSRSDRSLIGAIAGVVASECLPVVTLEWAKPGHCAALLDLELAVLGIRTEGDPRPRYWLVKTRPELRAAEIRRSSHPDDAIVWGLEHGTGALHSQNAEHLATYADDNALWCPAPRAVALWWTSDAGEWIDDKTEVVSAPSPWSSDPPYDPEV